MLVMCKISCGFKPDPRAKTKSFIIVIFILLFRQILACYRSYFVARFKSFMMKCTPQEIKNPMVQASKDEKSIAEISRITHKPWSACKDIFKILGHWKH